jgi:hypothetical protein
MRSYYFLQKKRAYRLFLGAEFPNWEEDPSVLSELILFKSGIIAVQYLSNLGVIALIKKKIQFSSYIRKFRIEQLQSHI